MTRSRGETYSASLGRGATRDGRPIRVSAADRLAVSLIAPALPTDFDADADRQTAYMRRFSTHTHSVRRTGSSALNLAILASGGATSATRPSCTPGTPPPGSSSSARRGARHPFNGDPYDLYGLQILATNGRVHEEAVKAFAEAWPPE